LIRRPVIIPEFALANQAVPHYFIVPEDNDTALFTSYLGTKYYTHVELSIPVNNNPNSLDPDPNTTTPSIIFRSALVTINQVKNIVKTDIQGRNGSIKEYISMGDYTIRIEGMLVSQNIDAPISFPQEEVEAFKEIMEFTSDTNDNNLDIICPLVNKFATRVVVDEYELREIQGSINALEFSITLSSDDNPLIYDTTTT